MSNPVLPDAPLQVPSAEPFGPEAFAAATGVSRETLSLLEAYGEILKDWNSRHNLVSENTMPDLWHRHMLDSAQLEPLIPAKAQTLADLGSGAGFPGLVLAIMRRDSLKVTLFEATKKKADFLTAVVKDLGLPVEVSPARIETTTPQIFHVITARAFAPLDQLLSYTHKFVGPRTICLFLKGQKLELELTEAARTWKMKVQKHPSKTHPLGVILEIRDLHHVSIQQRHSSSRRG
jgi:16S rRNA (guanine527-N7)-methyltransferase